MPGQTQLAALPEAWADESPDTLVRLLRGAIDRGGMEIRACRVCGCPFTWWACMSHDRAHQCKECWQPGRAQDAAATAKD